MQWTKPAVQDCKEILQPQIRVRQAVKNRPLMCWCRRLSLLAASVAK